MKKSSLRIKHRKRWKVKVLIYLNNDVLIAVYLLFKGFNDSGKYWFQVGVKNLERCH